MFLHPGDLVKLPHKLIGAWAHSPSHTIQEEDLICEVIRQDEVNRYVLYSLWNKFEFKCHTDNIERKL